MQVRNPFRSGLFKWPRRLGLRIPFWILMVALAWKTGWCNHSLLVPWRPLSIVEGSFLEPAKRQVSGKTGLTAPMLRLVESYPVFSERPALRGIRPVSLAIADVVGIGSPLQSGVLQWPESLWLRIPFWILALAWKAARLTYNLLVPWRPSRIAEVPFLDHARTQVSAKTRVTAAALGPIESYQVFGVPLTLRGIQPVWLDIANSEEVPVWYLRNHLRLWLTTIQFRGEPVWIGQISRDIGVRFIWDVPPTTHEIDPDTDKARDGLVQDLAYSQALSKFGYVKGVGAAPRSEPRENLTGDPYFTDGLRMVMFFRKRPTTLGDIEMLDWDRPPSLPQSGRLFGQGTPTNSVKTNKEP